MGAKKFFNQAQKEAEKAALETARLAKEAARLRAEEEAEERRLHLEKDPYSTLDCLLILALAEKFHPGKTFSEVLSGKPQKFLDIAFELVTKVKPAVLSTILQPIMKDPFPFKQLTERVETYQVLDGATELFLEEKFHGMLIHKGLIYPVKIYGEDQEAFEWGMASENQLYRMVAHCAAVAFGLDEIQCHVLLFAQWGFSHRMASVGHRVVDILDAYPDQDDAHIHFIKE